MTTKLRKINLATILAVAMTSVIAIVVIDSADSDAASTTFMDDGINYQVTSIATEDHTGTVKVIGFDSGYDAGETGLNLSATASNNGITYNVTGINKDAFKGCTSLYNVYVPSTMVLDIYAFADCTSLKTVVFEDGPTTLASSVFNGCTGLETVKLPSTLTEIPTRFLNTCTSLTSIEIPSSVTKIGSYAFGYSGITSLIIPDSVTEIGNEICFNCYSLKYVYVSGNLSIAGTSTFMNYGTNVLEAIVSSSENSLNLIKSGIRDNSTYPEINDGTKTFCALSKVSISDAVQGLKEMLEYEVPAWTITYVDGTGSTILSASEEATVSVNSDGSISVIYAVSNDIPTKDGCAFLGWAINGTVVTGSIVLTSDVVITAMWSSYTVTFDSNGGSDVESQTVAYGTVISLSEIVKDETSSAIYTFDGWFDVDGNSVGTEYTVTSDITLYAHFNETSKYTISFNSNGGSDVESITGLNGTSVEIDQVSSRNGCTFAGWYLDGQAVAEVILTSDVELTAQWDIIYVPVSVTVYTVTFEDCGSITVNDGSAIGNKIVADPEKEGYIFIGWYSDDAQITSETVVSSNMTVTAHWQIIDITTDEAAVTDSGFKYLEASSVIAVVLGVIFAMFIIVKRNY